MQLELNEEERTELVRLLNTAQGEANAELHHAMDHETRETFRKRRATLERLLQHLGADSVKPR